MSSIPRFTPKTIDLEVEMSKSVAPKFLLNHTRHGYIVERPVAHKHMDVMPIILPDAAEQALVLKRIIAARERGTAAHHHASPDAKFGEIRVRVERVADPKPVTKIAAPRKTSKKAKVCSCGCGGETKASFSMGHDAKLKSQLHKVRKALQDGTEVPALSPVSIAFLLQDAKWSKTWEDVVKGLRK